MDFDEVLRRAEMALRRAKSRGRAGGVEWYDESMEEVLSRRLAIEQELPGAIARGELDVAYQPIVELADSRPVGVEALLRWRHPSLGAVPTSALLPVAEDIGALDRIGDWVLHWTCRQLSVWAREGLDIWASVNVSVGQLAGPAFVASVTGALDAHLVPAARLMIEVAEPGLDRVGDAHPGDVDARAQAIAANLAELRALGVRTALDRFGSASTSLRQLRTLPIDLLKVDRQMFAGPVSRTAPASAVIDVVVRLGRQLGVDVVAQGLETDEDLAAARTAGCRFGQGYLLGRPQPAEHIEAYLAHALR
jgi:EAL domain-containing protein (putative c-di-GMP-specific phosphodiesterase class I)